MVPPQVQEVSLNTQGIGHHGSSGDMGTKEMTGSLDISSCYHLFSNFAKRAAYLGSLVVHSRPLSLPHREAHQCFSIPHISSAPLSLDRVTKGLHIIPLQTTQKIKINNKKFFFHSFVFNILSKLVLPISLSHLLSIFCSCSHIQVMK